MQCLPVFLINAQYSLKESSLIHVQSIADQPDTMVTLTHRIFYSNKQANTNQMFIIFYQVSPLIYQQYCHVMSTNHFIINCALTLHNVLLVKIEGPVWYTIYHHLPVVKGVNKPLSIHQPTNQPTNGKRTSMTNTP